MFVLYSLSMPRTVAPNEFSNKSLTDCSDGTTFSRLDSVLNTLVRKKSACHFSRKGWYHLRETITLGHKETCRVCNVIMELFVIDTGVNLDAHRLGTGYR